MKNFYKRSLLTFLLCITFVFPSYAQNNTANGYDVNTYSLITSSDQDRGYAISPRGMYISTAFLTISDDGNGQIRVDAETLAHREVDLIGFRIMLDRYIEEEDRWANVANYEFDYTKEDSETSLFSSKYISFNIINQPANCAYRLRGIHKVECDGSMEFLSTKTQGILLKK